MLIVALCKLELGYPSPHNVVVKSVASTTVMMYVENDFHKLAFWFLYD